jgi:hypothetical protein
MKRFVRALVVIFGLAVIGSVASLVPQKNATATGGAPVNIASPLPLPVTGNVSAAVTGTVAAQQSGAWSVGINGTPNVTSTIVGTPNVNVASLPAVQISGSPNFTLNNTPTTPLFNRDVDSPARLPFRVPLCTSPDPTRCFDPQVFTLPLGLSYFDFQGGTFTVSNPRFVIEQITAECMANPGTVLPELDVTTALTFPQGTLRSVSTFPLPITATLPDGEIFSVFAQMVRLYADPGTNLSLEAQHAQSTAPPAPASYVCNATLTGYLKAP